MTWDVPVKDDCPVCGHTMFKLSGRGAKKPFCINEQCANFTPEEKRGGWRKPAAKTESAADGEAPAEEKKPVKKTAAKKTATTAKKAPAAKKAGTTAKKATAAKKPTAK